MANKLLFRAGKPEFGDYAATGVVGLALGAFAATAMQCKHPERPLAVGLLASLVLQAIVGVPERK